MDESQLALQMWNCVSANDKKSAYSLIVRSRANVNLVWGDMPSSSCLTLGKALQLEQPTS
jgi:Arf-GAP/coiled-coil/ANK repeat/PH domain-containing protein